MTLSLWAAQVFGQVFVGIWSTNWPFILLPLLACFSADQLSSQLGASPFQNKKTHILAMMLTALPGMVFCSLGAYALYSLRRAEVDSALCVMVFVVPIIIFSAGICRALILLVRRRLLALKLLGTTHDAGLAVSELAARLGLNLRILPTDHLACMTIGAVRPTVVLSSGAVTHLSLSELHAVLAHEQVHVKRRDTLWASITTFIADCALPRAEATKDLARRIREISADYEACRAVDRFLLASVLIKFARHAPSGSYAFAESFAYPSTISERVDRLLNDVINEEKLGTQSLTLKIALAFVFVLYPYLVRLLAALWLHC